VVVVGGGFAGLRVCRALKRVKVRANLIDKRNFQSFAPILYQVATRLVPHGDVAIPLLMLVDGQANLRILLGEVREINSIKRSLSFNGTHLRYDHLVIVSHPVDQQSSSLSRC
jgi:NADH dehydrogenase